MSDSGRVPPSGAGPLILTTSGSTGVPKGVLLSDAGLSRFFAWGEKQFALSTGRRVFSYAPLNFDLSLLEIWAALHAGATVIAVSAREAVDGRLLRDMIREHRPHLLEGVPLLYRLLLQGADCPLPAPSDLIVTGEASSGDLRRLIAEHFPRSRCHNVYGSTETNDSFIFSTSSADFGTIDRFPIGRPIEGTRYRIVTDEGYDLEGAGVGELHTSTPFAALGYTNKERTGASFYRHDDCSFYRAGDVVRRDEDGALVLLGRKDLNIKVRGVRTNLRDIEIALERHPSVRAAVVSPLRDSAGDGSILHASVQIDEDAPVTALALRRHCADHLPRTALPHRFTVDAAPIPRTPNPEPRTPNPDGKAGSACDPGSTRSRKFA